MRTNGRTCVARLTTVFVCLCLVLLTRSAAAYSVLSHEEIVDMAWKTNIVPMLKARFPGISEDDIRRAHAYAYGGSVIQDIGYYPFGSHYFSDLLHYVRPEQFVNALIRDSTTPDEYAFALGALAHYCGDIIGHPAINRVTADENPPLGSLYGKTVTYYQNPTAHLRTEFGFDVVEVAQGHYSQQNYRDFIGFQVAKPLLDRAFEETYGIPIGDVMKHEDLAISTYRRSVSSIIPSMTKLAFVSYKNQIQQATPGIEKRKFLYRLNQTEFEKEFGTDYYHVGIGGHIVEFFLKLVPKAGPFKALRVSLPNPQEQDIYIKSMNASVDRFKLYLGEIHAAPAPLPPPDSKDAEQARKAADKVAKDVSEARRVAAEQKDPTEKAALEKVAVNVEKTSAKANAAADRTEAKVETEQAAKAGLLPEGPVAAGTRIQPPSTPRLPRLDLDTGGPSGVGEYVLADRTYAKLLGELVKNAKPVDAKTAEDVERFFAKPTATSGLAPSVKSESKARAEMQQVPADLATLKTLEKVDAK